MVSFPNVKINIGLNILSKRRDGYHNIASIFYPIPFEDALEIIPSKQFNLKISGLEVAGNKHDNLVCRAYHLLKKDHNISAVNIHLHKFIPTGAGLGGGSANAAFTIKILNDIFGLRLSTKQMLDYAAQLGSDCPFFIQNRPVLAEGRGDVLSEISINLTGKYLVLICPDISVSTSEAYKDVVPRKSDVSIKEIVKKYPLNQWKEYLINDFEESVFSKYPEIGKIKAQLYDAGAAYASMSGSGSSVYGLFEDKPFSMPFSIVTWKGFLP